MEKPGMESGIRLYGGLLTMRRLYLSMGMILIALVFPCLVAAGSGDDADLELAVSLKPEVPIADSVLVLSILVGHPRPSEVSVSVPDLPSLVTLERVATFIRSVDGVSGMEERRTVVELSLFLKAPGVAVIPSIAVSVPERTAETGPIELSIAGTSPSVGPVPVLAWRGVPARTVAGQTFTVDLVGSDLDAASGFDFAVSVPENALVETLDPGGRGLIVRLQVTPLAAGRVQLPSVVVRSGNAEYRSPPLGLPVAPALKLAEMLPAGAGSRIPQPGLPAPKVLPKLRGTAFDDLPVRPVPSFLAREFRKRLEPARAAWDSGEFAWAVAMLRKGERDSPAGFLISDTRRAAETVLGIEGAEDEPWAPPVLLVPLTLVSLFAALFAFAARRPGQPGQPGRGSRLPALAFLALPLLLLSSAWALVVRADAAGFFGSGSRVILRSCASYRVPDERSGPVDEFGPGQLARARSLADGWSYVEAADGRAGWIHRQNVIFY